MQGGLDGKRLTNRSERIAKYIARMDKGHYEWRAVAHMLTAFEAFIQADGIDGLAHPLAQYVSERLFQRRTILEEDLDI